MHFACLSRTRGCLHACQSARLIRVGRADREKFAGYFAIRHTQKDKGREIGREGAGNRQRVWQEQTGGGWRFQVRRIFVKWSFYLFEWGKYIHLLVLARSISTDHLALEPSSLLPMPAAESLSDVNSSHTSPVAWYILLPLSSELVWIYFQTRQNRNQHFKFTVFITLWKIHSSLLFCSLMEMYKHSLVPFKLKAMHTGER